MVGENNVTIDSLFRAGYDAIFYGLVQTVPQEHGLSTPGSKLHGVGQSTPYFYCIT